MNKKSEIPESLVTENIHVDQIPKDNDSNLVEIEDKKSGTTRILSSKNFHDLYKKRARKHKAKLKKQGSRHRRRSQKQKWLKDE